MPNEKQTTVLTVTELTSEIRFRLSNHFSNIWVSGEVSGLTRPSSGHLYFTLKDKSAQISGIIWRSNAQRMKFRLENGMDIICSGDVDVYPQRGNYQMIVRQAQPQGEGALQLAFRQLHAKLETAGLFDPRHKKRLPPFPRRVAVVTSPSGAAVRDFLQVLNRRWSNLEVIIVPAKVQGPGSADEIANAIGCIQKFSTPPEVVVVTRGGGSIEDLWSFNEEVVCRAIFDCPIPVICGVGHEIDVSLADLTADVRALTPSEAAERLVPEKRTVVNTVDGLRDQMRKSLIAKYQQAEMRLEQLASKPVITRPLQRVQTAYQDLDHFESQLKRAMNEKVTLGQHQLKVLTGQLESINPLSVLARGYSLTTDSTGQPITDCETLKEGDTINTRLANGTIVSVVESKLP